MDEIRRQLQAPFRYVVVYKEVQCGDRVIPTQYVFEKRERGFRFGDVEFSEEEMAGIIRDALSQGFRIYYTNQKEVKR